MPSPRPAPLQLTHDNTLPQPGRFVAPRRAAKPVVGEEPPPLKKFWNEVYQANWRNAVIAVAAINALRFLLHATTSFTDVQADKLFHAPKLAHISCAIGGLYLATMIIQVFGVVSALSGRLMLIKAFTLLQFLAGLLIVVAGFVSGITFFVLSRDLIRECVSLSVIGSLQTKPLFKGKAFKWSNPGNAVAETHCQAAWARSSVSQVLSIFLFSVIPAGLFFLLTFVYYRQVTDPDHSASLLGRKIKVASNPSLDADTRRQRHQSVPAIQLNGTPVDPDFAEGSRGLARPKKNTTRSSSVKSKKRNTIHGSSIKTPTSNSPYGISPGPPSYEDATRNARMGYRYNYDDGADSRVDLGRGRQLSRDSSKLV